MFGTMGISELIIILVIVLIIFGAGRLPQIGEGVGKALKGFKKEVNEVPQPSAVQPQEVGPPQEITTQPVAAPVAQAAAGASSVPKPNVPYVPGPEMTPGTTASMLYNMGPQGPQAGRATTPSTAPAADSQGQQVISMEERAAAPAPISRAQYPPLPPGAQPKPAAKRPSAIVNKDAVARVHAQQAESPGRASAERRLSKRYAALGRRGRRHDSHLPTSGGGRPQQRRSADADDPGRSGCRPEGDPTIH